MNDEVYEKYCMAKLHLEEELWQMLNRKEELLQEVNDLESDIEFTQSRLDNLSVEDGYCE